jgi:hypothetical protein
VRCKWSEVCRHFSISDRGRQISSLNQYFIIVNVSNFSWSAQESAIHVLSGLKSVLLGSAFTHLSAQATSGSPLIYLQCRDYLRFMMPQKPQPRGRDVGTPTTPPNRNRSASSPGRRIPFQTPTPASTNTTRISDPADGCARPKVDGTKYHKIRLKDPELKVLHKFLQTEREKDRKRSNESIFEEAIGELTRRFGEESRYEVHDLQNYWMTRGKKQTGLAWPSEIETQPDRIEGYSSAPRKAKVKVPSSLERPTFLWAGVRSPEWTEEEENLLLEEVKSARAARPAAGPHRDSDMTFWLKIRTRMEEAGFKHRTQNEFKLKWREIYKEEVEDDEKVRFQLEKETPRTQASARPLPPKNRYNSSERTKRRNENHANDYEKGSNLRNTQRTFRRRGEATKSPSSRASEQKKRQAARSAEGREAKKRRKTSRKVCESDEQSWRSNFEKDILVRLESFTMYERIRSISYDLPFSHTRSSSVCVTDF